MGRVKIGKGLHVACAILISASTSASASTDLPPRSLSFAYRVTHPVFPLPQSAMASLRDPDGDIVGAVDAATSPQNAPTAPEIGAKTRIPTQPALCRTVADVANTHNLPVPFFANLIWAESSFNAKVISRAGAQGIAQFMPKTAVMYGLENPFEPIHAINVSARFLVELREQFGNLGLAAAAYNAGPRRVSNWLANRSSLPRETQRYVRKITGRAVEQWVGQENVARAEIEPMPARAPCIEVAEAVLEQTRLARVGNLMRELVASVPPAETTPMAPEPTTMLARADRKGSPSRVAKQRPAVKDMRSKTQMANAKPAKLDVSASRKHNDERAIGVAPQESKTPNNVKRPNTSDKKVAAAASPKAPETPDTVVPAKVATPPSKPGPKANTERNHNRPVRRTRFAYSLHDNLH